jgi:hypothetical protein
MILGTAILALLTIAYIVALFCKIEGASSILVLVGSGLGFLLGGGRDKGGPSDT